MKGILRRITALGTALAVMSAAVVFDVPQRLAVEAVTMPHIHAICEGAVCPDPNHAAHTSFQWTEWTSTNSLPTSAGNYYLSGDVNVTTQTLITADITICLNGHTIKYTGDSNSTARIFFIKDGGSLTLSDCKSGSKLTGGKPSNDKYSGGAVYIEQNGTFIMYGGAISGNSARSGGGVFNLGTFIMHGGSVSNNETSYTAGGVYSATESFTMNGGSVSGNKAQNYGGGVYITGGGAFTMNGGSISSNTTTGAGGGLCINNGTFTMNDGIISGNTSGIGTTEGYGGGISLASKGTFIMKNGSISDNASAEYGGGLYNNNGTLTMSGGSISGNTCTFKGGGVFNNGTFTIDGNVTITDNTLNGSNSNLHLHTGKIITIGSNFSKSSKIGVTTNSSPDCNTPQSVTDTTAKSDIINSFTSDKGYTVVFSDGAIKLIGSHSLTETAAKDPTCTADGNSAYWTCSVCNKMFSDENGTTEITADDTVIKAGHTFSEDWSKDENNHWHKCKNCGATDTKAAHTWNSGTITKAATCTAKGVKTYTCTVCGQTKTEDIAATGHTLTETKAKAATCTEKGNTAYWYCSTCRKYFSDSASKTETTLDKTVIAAKGHTEVIIPTVAATCTKTGLTEGKKCSVCGAITKTQTTVSAKGHTEVTDAAKAPTCTETGLTEGKHCSVCDTVITAQTTVPATGHDWGDGVVTTTATEDSEGVKTFTCANCQETRTETIPKLDHVHSLTHHEKVDADCLNAGTVEYWHCEKCGNDYGDDAGTNQLADLTIPAKGHTEETDAAVAATCTETGLTEGSHCSVCKAVLTKQETVPALGHDWNEGEVTTAPTCTQKGVKTFACKRDNCAETKTEEIAAAGHTEVTDA
ncbi:MAG: hypothetical protein NC394_02970, partial [Bacteroides sp.]|nr:hypothetical protein [Bacteroides sp.]